MPLNRSENPIRLQQTQYWINWLSAGFASGKWNSLSLGRGFEFQRIVSFRDDPDIVRINWHASLTSEELMVSQYSEERNINLYLLADISPSMAFGSQTPKLDRLAILSAIISFSALKNKDRFRFVGFTDKVERKFPRGADMSVPLELARTIMNFTRQGKGDADPSRAALEVVRQKSLVIMMSDFLGDLASTERSLRMLSPRHEVIPIVIWDEREVALPEGLGIYPIEDLETGELSYVFLTAGVREKFRQNYLLRRQAIEELFGRFGVKPHFLIGGNPDEDIKMLMRIFSHQRGRI